jgi:aryl-alcohol dehydrogenase-like predicted oxidoreductase
MYSTIFSNSPSTSSYSAVEREHESIITAVAAKSGAGIVIRGGAAKGAPSGGGGAGMQQWERWQKARLDDLLEGMTPMEFILRFTFTHPDMATNIVGTINVEHLHDNINALLRGPLPPALYTEAKRRLARAGSAP